MMQKAHAIREDSDQTVVIPRLILVGHTSLIAGLSCAGSFNKEVITGDAAHSRLIPVSRAKNIVL